MVEEVVFYLISINSEQIDRSSSIFSLASPLLHKLLRRQRAGEVIQHV